MGVALAGTRVAWLGMGGGNTLETIVATATLARPTPVLVAYEASSESGSGDFAREPVGHGALLAFTVDQRCDADAELNEGPGAEGQCPPGGATGDVIAATVWRIGGKGRCPDRTAGSPGCTRVTQADGELTVLAVDAGRIVLRTETGVRLITAAGRLLRELAVDASAAALSGKRLALRSAAGVEIYDTGSGERTARFTAAQLEDLEGDILVTASGQTVTLRELGNGRTTTMHTSGPALAKLEPPGLYLASGRRITFTPMKDVLRRLAG